ncbi:hypothetical protein A2574_00655 [Candidatus Shapirobacteria bacterium RIFOXYD1_FULL_38_32]|uniref:DUF5659 domain-containing protein n=2 Tax=Candidatus Shapironibacteriota TaxID=1752721 RepID=A0A0G0JVI4_9BACT|nr:MAG: hypothetical protein US90_C0002G0021 [Candidatus Shapirobacteria bacterium GW2011_GWE2_38_30]OGL55850.1 MAG: hypothetical protein A2367_02525 [Candidatus Shapirobacteria bacterium RIFOXYB1_FULL_38_38]OGL55908.1 MAG: hypothetical protein A2195_03165 [Candidatus Shapirobacteria bacterium RIFOXYA1_FULL_39_17]OGL56861.1 MAG: hypothetical protein A2410_03995 [Candidatus Shapirobacteria bacterium RIFOXYC1_FULL_38_24]OGL57345.1 MAG: hypothetical protein A2574_00655 [Candidatus Shapirobacteria 
MEKQNKNQIWRCGSFYTVAFLILHGFDLVGVEPSSNPKRSIFVLKDSPERQELLQAFNFAEENSQSVLVDFRRAVSVIKSLKEKLYQEK